MKLLVIDHDDSFTYNLVQYCVTLGAEVLVFQHDALNLNTVFQWSPECVLLSPGPCSPRQTQGSLSVIEAFKAHVPILGVCLGHQCIGVLFGGRVIRAQKPMHGKTSLIYHRQQGVFEGLPNPVMMMRYHSLVVEWASLPACLEVTAWTQDEAGVPCEIMGLKHRDYPHVEGIQFHPESVLSEYGYALLGRFLSTHTHSAAISNDASTYHVENQ
jgi:anthranilate synthase component 2